MIRAWFRRNGERLAVWTLAVVLVLASVGVVAVHPLPVDERAVAAAVEEPSVSVTETDTGYTVRPLGDDTDASDPTASDPAAALVLYPGGLVPTRAYLPLAVDVATESGLTVFLVDVPLNLAVLDVDAANGVVGANPEIDRWYVGGHSLGGAMACRYASANPERVEGVVLLGAYCDVDLRDTDLDALTVVGTRDAVVNREALSASRDRLPADARFAAVEGMNHTQFGVYGGQADARGTISDEEARQRVAAAVASWAAERADTGADSGVRAEVRPVPVYGDGDSHPR